MLTDVYLTDAQCDELRRKRFARDMVDLDLSNGPVIGNVNLTIRDLNALTFNVDMGE